MTSTNNHIAIFLPVLCFCLWNSCSNENAKKNLNQSDFNNETSVNDLLIGAYSMLDGVSSQSSVDAWEGASTNWLWGSIRGLEANNGTNTPDQAEMNAIQTFTENGTNGKINDKWRMLYEGISRCNAAIEKAGIVLDAGGISKETHEKIIKQARALRGHYHFEAWRMWRDIPYVDETTDPSAVTNTVDIRNKILKDLEAGTTLPEDMDQIGRFNGTVCKVLLAKALMQMNHKYNDALVLLIDVHRSGKKPDGSAIGLASTYGEIFDIDNRNGIESVYTIQYSVNDGSGGAAAGNGEILNSPASYGSPAGYCGFFIPNQEFVNTFRTAGGLPMANYEYNLRPVINDQGIPRSNTWTAGTTYSLNEIVTITDPNEPAYRNLKAYKSKITENTGNNPLATPFAWTLAWQEDPDPLDPRIDWSVGRRGIPFWDWGVHTGSDWIRDQSYSGPYSPKKQVYKKSQTGEFTEVGGWTNGWIANGYRMIRYADILLMIAECYIEKTGATASDIDMARTYINRVRNRAANPAGFVKETIGTKTTNAANYSISTYDEHFANIEEARYALRIERKLELGLEGHRYFDLNRWGITVTELNRILAYQKTMSWGPALYGNAVVSEEDVTYPIPQRQIDLSNGAIKPNR